MRILIDIDVSALAESGKPESVFWRNALPELVRCLDEHTVYLLSRGSRSVDLHGTDVHHLNAPTFDVRNSVTEDRRLAALCSELEIDIFLSTFCSSAGTGVRSVFVALDSRFDQTATRSAKLAFARVSVSSKVSGGAEVARRVVETYSLAPDTDGETVRAAQEALLRAELQRLRALTLRKAENSWNEAMRGGPLVRRIFRAITSVNRYPELLRRFRRAMSQ